MFELMHAADSNVEPEGPAVCSVSEEAGRDMSTRKPTEFIGENCAGDATLDL